MAWMPRRRVPLQLTPAEERALERFARDPARPPREALRAEMVLRAASGATDQEVADQVGASAPTVASWRNRYAAEGLSGLHDRSRPGRPRMHATTNPGAGESVALGSAADGPV